MANNDWEVHINQSYVVRFWNLGLDVCQAKKMGWYFPLVEICTSTIFFLPCTSLVDRRHVDTPDGSTCFLGSHWFSDYNKWDVLFINLLHTHFLNTFLYLPHINFDKKNFSILFNKGKSLTSFLPFFSFFSPSFYISRNGLSNIDLRTPSHSCAHMAGRTIKLRRVETLPKSDFFNKVVRGQIVD